MVPSSIDEPCAGSGGALELYCAAGVERGEGFPGSSHWSNKGCRPCPSDQTDLALPISEHRGTSPPRRRTRRRLLLASGLVLLLVVLIGGSIVVSLPVLFGSGIGTAMVTI